MGYRKNFRTQVIRYDGEHPLAGFTCSVRALPFGQTLDLQERGYELRQHENGSPEYRAAFEALVAQFASRIQSWNVEDAETGEPVPPSAEAVFSEFEGDLGQDIILDWIAIASGRVSDPKDEKPSGSGQNWEGEAIPMELL